MIGPQVTQCAKRRLRDLQSMTHVCIVAPVSLQPAAQVLKMGNVLEYRVCVCSSLTHCCEAWTLNRAVTRTINGFNSRCLHVLTGEQYRETAIAPAYDLVLAVRRRRLRYLGHVLRMPAVAPVSLQPAAQVLKMGNVLEYRVCVCSSLTHCCEAWTLNRAVTRTINGFNSRCLHVLTGEQYRETAIAPAYDLVLAVRRRRLRYLGHVLRMPAERMVRRALLALVSDSVMYPTGSLFSDCQSVALSQIVAMASSRSMWRARVASLL